MNCIDKIAESIMMDCQNPLVAGYTGRGVLIPWEDVTFVVQDETNPRKVFGITLASGANVCAIDASGTTNPFDGSTTTGNADSGFYQFVKVVAGRILTRGAETSKNLVEPLTKSPHGFIAVLEKNDKVGDGSYEVIGVQSPLKCVDPSTVVRNESENGGSTSFSLQSTEAWFELTLCPHPKDGESQWHASKQVFDQLFDNAL